MKFHKNAYQRRPRGIGACQEAVGPLLIHPVREFFAQTQFPMTTQTDSPEKIRLFLSLAFAASLAFGACAGEQPDAGAETDRADAPEATADLPAAPASPPGQPDTDTGARPADGFTPVRIDAGTFAIVRIHEEPGPDTREVTGGEEPDVQVFHVDKEPAIDGSDITGVQIYREPFISLRVELTPEASERFARFTAENAGAMAGILIDGKPHSMTAIPGPVETRHLQLPGALSEEDAEALVKAWSSAAP